MDEFFKSKAHIGKMHGDETKYVQIVVDSLNEKIITFQFFYALKFYNLNNYQHDEDKHINMLE
jgi:hypothetical protein